MPGGFWPLPHAGHENPEADTHVESFEGVPSDAGSTPAASTNFASLSWCSSLVVRQAGIGLRPRLTGSTPFRSRAHKRASSGKSCQAKNCPPKRGARSWATSLRRRFGNAPVFARPGADQPLTRSKNQEPNGSGSQQWLIGSDHCGDCLCSQRSMLTIGSAIRSPSDGVKPTAVSILLGHSNTTIFTVFPEQLGLKLEATRSPVDVLVIDQISPPTPD